MNASTIAAQRLINQQIAQTNFTKPKDIVHWLGAVQAQDYNMAKWAIGLRLPGSTSAIVEDALNAGTIMRTHILRPTWHFVAAGDIRWMLPLTAPHIKKAVASNYRNLELNDKVFAKTNKLIAMALQGGQQLTRQELTTIINKAGIVTNALRASHIMFQAEMDGLICNGAKRGKQFTYALLDERVPPSAKTFIRDEALAALACRHFNSHGPATIQDFAWWSGLPMIEAKLGLELVKSNFVFISIDEQTYWLSASTAMEKILPTIYLLPAFDEFMVSYKDRTASLFPAYNKEAITNNGIFRPIIVVNGNIMGLWKPTFQKGTIRLELLPFDTSGKLNPKQVALAAKKYAAFQNTAIEII